MNHGGAPKSHGDLINANCVNAPVLKFLHLALQTGVPFGMAMSVVFSLIGGWRVGVPAGAVAGLLFGVALVVFVQVQARNFRKNRPHFDGEEVLHEGPANHFLNGEGVGGWLYLTTGRVAFRSHTMNFQTHAMDWPLREIASAAPCLTAKFLPSGLRLSLVSGVEERFVVSGRKQWSELIEAVRKQPN